VSDGLFSSLSATLFQTEETTFFPRFVSSSGEHRVPFFFFLPRPGSIFLPPFSFGSLLSSQPLLLVIFFWGHRWRSLSFLLELADNPPPPFFFPDGLSLPRPRFDRVGLRGLPFETSPYFTVPFYRSNPPSFFFPPLGRPFSMPAFLVRASLSLRRSFAFESRRVTPLGTWLNSFFLPYLFFPPRPTVPFPVDAV